MISKNPEINIKLEAQTIDLTDAKNQIMKQTTLLMQRHIVNKGYLILSKNDFGKIKKRINVGIFNRKTNFIVGETKSLLVWDNQQGELTKPNTSEIKKNPSRYFLPYDLNFIFEMNNKNIEIINKKTKEKKIINLNKKFGFDIGNFLKLADIDKIEFKDEYEILESIIFIKNGRLSINKQLLINSNYNFLLGILEGFIQDKFHCYINKNINLYNFTYILNLLGAQYSIRNSENNEKHIRFRLPFILKGATSLNEIFFRNHKYLFNNNGELYFEKHMFIKNSKEFVPSFKNLVNLGLIELIPAKDLVFEELKNPNVMYDFTMGYNNANNFAFPCTPYLSNSDGDILGIIGMLSKDGAEECEEKFGVVKKNRFLNLSNAKVNNYGCKLDSIMGLYSATK
jgi:hypothetical protein